MAIETANDNFNWDELEATLSTVEDDQLITGTVVGLTERDVIVNIGFKSDGLVSRNEFRGETLPQPGETVEVLVENTEDPNGQLILSRKKAKVKQAWQSIYDALEQDTILEGIIKRRTKGGLIMEINGVEAFLPGSQIDVKPVRDFDIYVGKRMEVKVVKINAAFDNVVVSHKVLIEKDLEAQRAAILNNLEKGQVLEGVIKNMTNFGVFIDLGGVDGLLHITDISWGRVQHPSEALKLDEKVRIVVLDFDEDKKRISLGMKQLLPHPWDSLPADLGPGSRVGGRVVNVADYGAFMEVVPGVEGLIHVSEMSWSQHLRDPKDFVKANDQIEAVVLTLDREERKMSLGLKQLTPDPWTREDFAGKYAVGTKHNGLVRNLTNFGLFVELEEGVDGLVHVSDLSWTKKVKHPSEFVKVGERLDVIVLEVDVANRRLALGHKQLEENPWDAFTAVFVPGSIHKGTIIEKTERGATVELPYGIEGFVYPKNLVKQDGANVENGETLEFRVTDFSKDDRRVVLSHVATYTEQKVSDADRDLTRFTKKKGAAAATPATGAAGAAAAPAEKSTMGDLDALSALKAKMLTNESNVARATLDAKADAAAADAEAPAAADEAATEEA
jgi:small subunit ribosomal protein S1